MKMNKKLNNIYYLTSVIIIMVKYTYKQIQDSWIKSQWINSNVEEFGEDEEVILPNNDTISVTLEDIIDKNITESNYLDIIKISNYIMIDNVDPIVNAIVKATNNVDIIYEFEEFYRLSEKIKPITEHELRLRIKHTKHSTPEGFYVYGHLNFWDVSQVNNMSGLFCNSEFTEDIHYWDVSNVITMEYMFFNSKFKGNISNWDVSNVKNMRFMFSGSHFNGDISNWDVSNVAKLNGIFYNSQFNGNISLWKLSKIKNYSDSMLYDNNPFGRINIPNVSYT